MKRRLISVLVIIQASISVFATDYDIVDFGAKSRKGNLNTDCIQNAINKCSAEGGGRVIIPRGEWLTGTVELKNGVILYLEPGAVLQGSDRMSDYTKNLVRAVKADGVGVEGYGVIDGSGHSFWKVDANGFYDHDRPVPGYMLYFEACNNVSVRGVTLRNAESWTVHLLGCKDVRVRDVTIRNPLHGPNNDGIDIQSCKNVTVSGCDIYTSDDGICLKNRHPQYNHIPCANISVTNCIVTSVCNCLKIGTETIGEFRNINFSNCTIRQAQPTDELALVRASSPGKRMSAISGISIESVDGSRIDGVTFNNITMENVCCPVFIRLANRGAGVQKNNPPQPGSIRNVVISNVTVRNAKYASSITAIPGSYVENVILSNIIVNSKGLTDDSLVKKLVDERIDSYPDAHMWKDLPASSVYVRHVKGLSMTDMHLKLDALDNRPLVILEDVFDVMMNGVLTDANPCGEAVIRMNDVHRGRFSGFDVNGSPQFLFDLKGTGNTDIHLSDVDPTRVRSERSYNVIEQTSIILE